MISMARDALWPEQANFHICITVLVLFHRPWKIQTLDQLGNNGPNRYRERQVNNLLPILTSEVDNEGCSLVFCPVV